MDFWKDKVKRNIKRDALSNQNLEVLSWSVITVWECELKPKLLPGTMERIMSELSANQMKWEEYRELRRKDRAFAVEQARRHRELLSRLDAELDLQFHIPERIRRMSRKGQ